jgi:DNA-binding GntR family transcriptional regulator
MRLKPEHIAETMGLSRMPVREALRQLDSEGLVTIHPNRGASVTLLTADDILEFFEMRAALEGVAVRLATPNIGDDGLHDLDHYLEKMRRSENDHLVWIDRHDEFHEFLCGWSRRPRLCAEIKRLRITIVPYLRLYTAHFQEREIPGYEHEVILDAIRQGDPDVAEDCMRKHVMANAHNIAHCLSDARNVIPAAGSSADSKPGSGPAGALSR